MCSRLPSALLQRVHVSESVRLIDKFCDLKRSKTSF